MPPRPPWKMSDLLHFSVTVWFTTCKALACILPREELQANDRNWLERSFRELLVSARGWVNFRSLVKRKDESVRTQVWKHKSLSLGWRLKVEVACYCTANTHFQFPYCLTASLHGLCHGAGREQRFPLFKITWKKRTLSMNETFETTTFWNTPQ